jgi:hypothetical protein
MKHLIFLALVATAIFGSTIRTSAVYTMHLPSQYSDIEIDSELGYTSNSKLEIASPSNQQDCLAFAMINGYNPNIEQSETNWIDCNYKNIN